jgi:hypothetical protein
MHAHERTCDLPSSLVCRVLGLVSSVLGTHARVAGNLGVGGRGWVWGGGAQGKGCENVAPSHWQ